MIIIFGYISFTLNMNLNAPLEIGENHARPDSTAQIGGNASIQAIAAVRAGAKASLSGTIGNDIFGKSILDTLRHEGINTTGIAKDEHLKTGLITTFSENDGTPTSINLQGANARTHEAQLPDSAFNERTILLLQNEIKSAKNINLMHRAKKQNGKTILSLTNRDNTSDELLNLADLIIDIETENSNGFNCFCGTMAACLQAGMDQDTAAHYAQTAAKLAAKNGGGYSALPYLDNIEKAL